MAQHALSARGIRAALALLVKIHVRPAGWQLPAAGKVHRLLERRAQHHRCNSSTSMPMMPAAQGSTHIKLSHSATRPCSQAGVSWRAQGLQAPSRCARCGRLRQTPACEGLLDSRPRCARHSSCQPMSLCSLDVGQLLQVVLESESAGGKSACCSPTRRSSPVDSARVALQPGQQVPRRSMPDVHPAVLWQTLLSRHCHRAT